MTFILVTHIITFSLSMLLSTSSLGWSVFGKRVSSRVTAVNIGITTYGTLSGVALLLTKPLGAQCAVLVGYVSLFILANIYISRRNAQLVVAAQAS